MKSDSEINDTVFFEIRQTADAISRIVNSFPESEISTRYNEFLLDLNKYVEQAREVSSLAERRFQWIDLGASAGKLQKALRDELISLRDT